MIKNENVYMNHILYNNLSEIITVLYMILSQMLFFAQINKLEEAVQDCTKAVELDDTYLKAFMRRAKW